MFHQIVDQTTYICSECARENFFELVYRDNACYRRCRWCEHEALEWTMTTTWNESQVWTTSGAGSVQYPKTVRY